jgi:hypothetical protein
MEAYKVREAYAEWIDTEQYDLFITLNTESKKTFKQLSTMIRQMFGGAETHYFGYTKEGFSRRKLYSNKDKFHIKRVVAIEGDNKLKKRHSHILVKNLEGVSKEGMAELLRYEWLKLNKAKKNKEYLFKVITDYTQQAVSRYNTKDTNKQNKQLEDVICYWSSFISKQKLC